MTNTPQELDLIRTQLRVAIERDLHRRMPRSRVTRRRSVRVGIPILGAVTAATAAVVLSLTLTAATPASAYAAAKKALAATATANSGTITGTVRHDGSSLHARHNAMERQRDRGDARRQRASSPRTKRSPDRRRGLPAAAERELAALCERPPSGQRLAPCSSSPTTTSPVTPPDRSSHSPLGSTRTTAAKWQHRLHRHDPERQLRSRCGADRRHDSCSAGVGLTTIAHGARPDALLAR